MSQETPVQRRSKPDHCKLEDSKSTSNQNRESGVSGLKCFYTNANSLLNKIYELRQRAQGYDVIGIVETWVNEHAYDSEY